MFIYFITDQVEFLECAKLLVNQFDSDSEKDRNRYRYIEKLKIK